MRNRFLSSLFNQRFLKANQLVLRLLVVLGLVTALTVSGCSGESFHLRSSVALQDGYQRLYLQGEPYDGLFGKALRRALEEVGSELVESSDNATAIIKVNNYKEGKRVAGYGKDREVREYLIFLNFDYLVRSINAQSIKVQSINAQSVNSNRTLLKKSMINLDKLQIYDSAFVLGKIEEERLIKEDLRKNAARQILLRLQYGKQEE